MNLTRLATAIFVIRASNLGLMMIGPILLTRLLTVSDFGEYREFLVYTTALMPIATFCFGQSLMYFVPTFPDHIWQIVGQSVRYTAIGSFLLTAVLAVADTLLHGSLLGPWGIYILGYVLLSVNVDFFEQFWISQAKTNAAFLYSSSRLILRLLFATVIAYLTRDVSLIIKSLLVLEGARLLWSLWMWRRSIRPEAPPRADLPRLQRDYCLPLALSMMMGTFNKYIGNILIARMIGPEGLAQYAVSTYAVPIIYVLRNSVSEALLPKLAGEASARGGAPELTLWTRTNAVFAILLIPVGVLLARYADLVVTTLFSAKYEAAVVLFQVYMLSLITDTVDFGVSFRLLNITRKFVRGYVGGMIINITTLVILLPRIGPMGAAIALMAGQYFASVYFGWVQSRLTGDSLPSTLGLPTLGRTLLAAACATPVLLIPVGRDFVAILVAGASCIAFLALYVTVLWKIGNHDVRSILHEGFARARRLLAGARHA